MMALVYIAKWFQSSLATPLPESLRPHIEKLEKVNNTFIPATYLPDEGYDHLNINFNADFSSRLVN